LEREKSFKQGELGKFIIFPVALAARMPDDLLLPSRPKTERELINALKESPMALETLEDV
jgi:hypothetical protein